MNSKLLIFIVILLVGCLTQVGSDIYAPSIPAIAHYFSSSISHLQFSMALYMLGVALSLFFYGPISDGLGRRVPLMIGLSIMLVGTLLCIFATNINMLLIGRFIQGAGAGAGAGLWRSIFRDSYSGNKLAKYSSYLTIGVTIFVPVAPALGGFFQQYISWKATFVFLLIYAMVALAVVIFKFKETSVHHHKSHLQKTFILKSFKSLLTSRTFMINSLCVFLTYGAVFSWFAIGPALLIHDAHIRPVVFGWLNLLMGVTAFSLGGLINGKLVERLGSRFMLQTGWLIMLIAGILLLLLKFIVGMNVWAIMAPVILFTFGAALIWPNAFSGAMKPFPYIAGYAGSMYSAFQLGGGAALAFLAAHLPTQNQIPLALIFIITPLLAWSVFKFLLNNKAV